jgi:riboflavin synthase
MFTGIVEARGTVEEVAPGAAVVRVVIATALPVEALPLGASIAVDGVCLTVTWRAAGRFAADLGPETLACTTLGALRPGARVHLERPLNLGDALGGHLVSGHVDGVAEVTRRREREGVLELEIEAPPAVAATLVVKGSITVDGVSLTVNAVSGRRFQVTLIPHTLEVTNLGEKAVGAPVNLEADLIAKSVERMVAARFAAIAASGEVSSGPADRLSDADPAPPRPAEPPPGLTLKTLRKHGFAR